MVASLIAVLLLSAPVLADQIATPCPQDAMTREWQAKTFGLWLTDGTNPDATQRTATLKFKSCNRRIEALGESTAAQDARLFVSEDGSIGVIATVGESDDATTWLTLVTRNAGGGLAVSSQLGAFAHHRVYEKGVGVDQVKIWDWRDGGKTIIKNVFLVPGNDAIKF